MMNTLLSLIKLTENDKRLLIALFKVKWTKIKAIIRIPVTINPSPEKLEFTKVNNTKITQTAIKIKFEILFDFLPTGVSAITILLNSI